LYVSLLFLGVLTGTVFVVVPRRPEMSSGRLEFLGISTTEGTNVASFRLRWPTNSPLELDGLCRCTAVSGKVIGRFVVIHSYRIADGTPEVTIRCPVPTSAVWCLQVDLFRPTRGLEMRLEQAKAALRELKPPDWQQIPAKLVQTLVSSPITNDPSTAEAPVK